MHVRSVVWSIVALVGCAAGGEADLCADATAHLNQCGIDVPASAQSQCDVDGAAMVLSQDCDTLSADKGLFDFCFFWCDDSGSSSGSEPFDPSFASNYHSDYPSSGSGATSDNCQRYAELSLQHVRANRTERCGFTGNEWTAGLAGHGTWCQERGPSEWRAELRRREDALEACRNH